MSLLVSVPDIADLDAFDGMDVHTVLWDMQSPPPRDDLDMAIIPRRMPLTVLRHATGLHGTLLQHTSIGYDDLAANAPAGLRVANAAGVYEDSTAELALALILAAQRGLPRVVHQQDDGRWERFFAPGLADAHVLLIGVGGVGQAIAARIQAFGADITFVASTAREGIHGASELPMLLPHADIVIVIVPLTASTRGMVDDAFLSSMKDGALFVNMARGAVADTQALLAHAHRLRYALDVTDPEPLPEGHPLFALENAIISPHVGGMTAAEKPRERALWRRQAGHLLVGEEPENIVWPR